MNTLHKNSDNDSSMLTPEGGQREFLCSNNELFRCSPSVVSRQEEFSKDDRKSFIELAQMLKRVHIRLLIEGYAIQDGLITK